MRPGRLVLAWAAYWAAAGCGFYAADRRGVALCEAVRHLFRLRSSWAGRVVFTACYGIGAAVLHQHVVKPLPPEDRRG